MSALRVERDGAVLRVTMARPERRNAFDASLIAELTAAFADVGDARAVVLAGDGPSFSRRRGRRLDALVRRAFVRRERCRRAAATRDARGDRLVPRPGCRARSGSRARRRLRARRVLRRRRRRARRAIRVQRGEARHRPGGDLTVRPREDREQRSPALLRHRRALRRGRRAADRSRPRGRRRPRRCGRARCSRSSSPPARRPPVPRRSSRAAPHAARETAERIAAHRTSDEGQDGLRAFLEKRAPGWHGGL